MMKVESQIKIEDLTTLLTLASRLLTAVASLGPFQAENIGLAEWITLAILEKKGALNSKQLSRMMGVTKLRANQLLVSLSREELATIREAGDRRSVVEVSPEGQQRLAVVNAGLQEFLDKALAGREATLPSATRHVYALWRLIEKVAPELQGDETSYASSVGRLHQ